MFYILATTLSSCAKGTPLGVIVGLAKDVVDIIYVATPICIILFGTFDLFKAVIAQDDAQMKKAFPTFGKRILAAIVVWLLFTIIKYVFTFIVGTGALSSWLSCWK